MAKKRTKTEDAAVVTETSEAIAVMAQEFIGEAPAVYETLEEATLVAEAVAEIESLEAEVLPVEDHSIGFDDMLAQITDQDRIAATVAMAHAVDERAAYEAVNGNDNIQKTLKKAREAFTSTRAGAVLLACGVDEAFVNRSVHDGKRYNVYAFGKLADAILALSGGAIQNKINFAIMRSLFNARRAGVSFTGEVAKMAASDKIRVTDAAIKAILIRHTVSATTAPTQASSTMQALETLGLVKREGSSKNPTYTLTSHPAVAKLEEALAKAA